MLVLAGLIAFIAVLDAVVGIAERWQSARIGEGIILDLRRAVFAHVQRMPVAFFTRTRTGALVSRLNNDVIGAQRAFTWTLSGVVSNLIALVLTLAVMLRLSWSITALALILLPLFVIPARRMGARLAHLEREAAAHNAAMTTQMTERFSAPGATLVKLFGRPAHEEDEFVVRAERVAEIGVRTAMGQWIFLTALALVSALALALVYGLGGYLALDGRLETGTVVTLALLLTRLYAPLTALASARVDAMTALVSFERVFEVLDLPPLITEKPDAVALPDGPVSLEFDDVRFAYPSAEKVSLASLEEVATLDTRGGAEVLHGVSFRVEPGQVVALVGTSGSGKSTIAALAPRLYDVDAGAVRLSGIDVRDLTFDSIRATLGMVTQDGHLFHDTVRENLVFARPDATEAELWEALRQARLDDLIASLPGGLDTVVGERGYRLSGGERQRLTIARLLLARPRVVILDEATAHLDSSSEAAVQAALADALAGRTALVIAHRLSTIRDADAILVVEAGRSSSAAPMPSCSPPAVATPSSTGPSSRTTPRRPSSPDARRRYGRSPAAGRITRRSVTIAVTRSAGVTSKARFNARAPRGAVATPPSASTSSSSRTSISMPSPDSVAGSSVDSGAATTNGTPARAAASASGYVPILLAVSPLAAIRSAPTTTTSARPRAITVGPAESTTIWWSIPSSVSSNAVKRDPCRSGRVSSAVTDRNLPRSWRTRTMPSAVPHSTHASAPVLQWVCTRMGAVSVNCSSRSAPRWARARLARTSSSPIATASAITAAAPSSSRPRTRRTAHDRLTAVGRAAAIRSASTRTTVVGSPSRSARSAAMATPNAPATPIAGAPRTARRVMASIIVSTSRTSIVTTSCGRRV